jgi:hypothetical protein
MAILSFLIGAGRARSIRRARQGDGELLVDNDRGYGGESDGQLRMENMGGKKLMDDF